MIICVCVCVCVCVCCRVSSNVYDDYEMAKGCSHWGELTHREVSLHTHINMHMFTHTYTYYTQISSQTYMYMYVHTPIHSHMQAHAHTHTHTPDRNNGRCQSVELPALLVSAGPVLHVLCVQHCPSSPAGPRAHTIGTHYIHTTPSIILL